MNNIDEFAGLGGSYLVGADGKRVLVERTREPAPLEGAQEPDVQAPAATVDEETTLPPVTTKKGA